MSPHTPMDIKLISVTCGSSPLSPGSCITLGQDMGVKQDTSVAQV